MSEAVNEAVFHTFYQDLPLELVEKLKKIRLVVFDVDGTLSDGAIILDNSEGELKRFNCKDGMGIALLQKAGIKVAILTGRYSNLTTRRAKELKVPEPYIVQGELNKEEALLKIMNELNFSKEDLAVMGDDINDVPLYQHASIAACPKDGYHYMQTIANLHLTQNGGFGAAREFADLILMAKGLVTPEGYATFLQQGNGLDFNRTAQ